jgi:hypothetical protein
MGETPDFGSLGLGDNAALEDAKAFNKGKGKLLAGMLSIVVLAVGAFAWYLVQDQPNPYGELGKQVNGLRGSGFDAFWTCALPGTRPGDLKSDADLRTELHQRGAAGARYGTHLRSKCQPGLRELAARLRALLPPEDAAVKVKAMADAVTKMDVGTSRFATHLDTLEGGYSAESAESEQADLVRGWYDFRTAHAELNKLVKDRLGR